MECTVLIVEDDWLIAEDEVETLRDAGYAIAGPFASVQAALAALDSQRVDAAFLDVELRDGKSFPVAERLQQLGIPFCFISGHESQDNSGWQLSQRALVKPAEPQALLEAARIMTTPATGDRIAGRFR